MDSGTQSAPDEYAHEELALMPFASSDHGSNASLLLTVAARASHRAQLQYATVHP